MASYIIDPGQSSESVDEFEEKLKQFEMPDYSVRVLFTIIHAILPLEAKADGQSSKEGGGGKVDTKFKALAIADSRERVKELDK